MIRIILSFKFARRGNMSGIFTHSVIFRSILAFSMLPCNHRRSLATVRRREEFLRITRGLYHESQHTRRKRKVYTDMIRICRSFRSPLPCRTRISRRVFLHLPRVERARRPLPPRKSIGHAARATKTTTRIPRGRRGRPEENSVVIAHGRVSHQAPILFLSRRRSSRSSERWFARCERCVCVPRAEIEQRLRALFLGRNTPAAR